MQVTLENFLKIVGNSLIETFICEVYIETEDEILGTENKLIEFSGNKTVQNIEELQPYLNHEVVKFNQKTCYGEIVEQSLYLRKI